MKEYTIAYNSRCYAGWSDRQGNLYGDVVETFDDQKTAERIADELNKTVGYEDCFGDYLTFFVEEMENEEEGSKDNA